jgi:hypothetical protein
MKLTRLAWVVIFGATSACSRVESVATSVELFGSAEDRLAREVRIDSSIKRCMKRAGWEYESNPNKAVAEDVTFQAETSELRKNAYGLTKTLLAREVAQNGTGTSSVTAFVDTLTDQERQMYLSALRGDTPGKAGGCLQSAVLEESGVWGNPSFRERIGDFRSLVEGDPEVVAATRAWSNCLGSGGFRYLKPQDTREDLTQKAGNLLSKYSEGVPAIVVQKFEQEERLLASMDASCRDGKLVKAYSDAETRVATRMLRKYRTG